MPKYGTTTEIQHVDGTTTTYAHRTTPTIDQDVLIAAIDQILAPAGLTACHATKMTIENGLIQVEHVVTDPCADTSEFPVAMRDRRSGTDEFAELMNKTTILVDLGGESK